MATYRGDSLKMTLPQAADLTGYEGCAANINTSGQAALQATAGGRAEGVIDEITGTGVGAAVRLITHGPAKALAGTAGFTAGDDLEIEVTTGRFVVWSGDSDNIVGTAITTATVGTFGEIIFRPIGRRS